MFSDDEQLIMKTNGIVAIYGASNDLVELEGVIKDELSAWGEITFCLAKSKDGWEVFENDYDGKNELIHEAILNFTYKLIRIKSSYGKNQWEHKVEAYGFNHFSVTVQVDNGEILLIKLNK